MVKGVIQTLIKIVHVAKDNRVAKLHGNLDLVDVTANLGVLLIKSETRSKHHRHSGVLD